MKSHFSLPLPVVKVMTNFSQQSVKISIQQEDYNLAEEVGALELNNHIDGAVVTFSGLVRNNNLGEKITALELEHYPGMTEKQLDNIITRAKSKWQLGNITVIHRIGYLPVGQQIVFVGVTSKHRKNAFAACEYIMDFLKIEATFWKKEHTEQGKALWLDARQSDKNKATDWQGKE